MSSHPITSEWKRKWNNTYSKAYDCSQSSINGLTINEVESLEVPEVSFMIESIYESDLLFTI